MLKKIWWCLFPPGNVCAFYLAGSMRMRMLVGTEMAFKMAKNNFKSCSKEEQDFILWRDPIFKKLFEEEK